MRDFLKKRLTAVADNAVGNIIAAFVITSGAIATLVKPVRDFMIFAGLLKVPLWTVFASLPVCIICVWIILRRRRRARTISMTQLKNAHSSEMKAAQQTIMQLRTALADVETERDDAIKAKTMMTFRLQELGRRIGVVSSIRPASGAARTR